MAGSRMEGLRARAPVGRRVRLTMTPAVLRSLRAEAGVQEQFPRSRRSYFTSRLLRRWLRAQGIRQRLGAIGKTGSIAIIERFWRTLKSLLGLPFAPPLLRADLQRRLDATIAYYAELKPHHGLDGDTPDHRYFEREDTRPNLRSPPRGRRGEKSPPAPFRIAFFRRNPRLPYLVPRSA